MFWSSSPDVMIFRDGAQGQQNIIPQNICNFGILIISSCRPWKNSKCKERLFLNSSYMPTDRSSKRNEIVVINPLPGHQPGKAECWHHTQTITPPIHSYKGLFLFPRNHWHYTPLRGLHPPSPFPIIDDI